MDSGQKRKVLRISPYLAHIVSPIARSLYTEHMAQKEVVVYETDTPHQHYQVVDMEYDDRPSRVLFSGNREAAQSGIAYDDKTDLLFDYNQRIFELVENTHPKSVLVIGGGVYTLPMALVTAFPKITVDVVEPDTGLDEIAATYFGFVASKQLNVFHMDGRKFLASHDERYDLIVVDAFTDTIMPKSLLTRQAISLLKTHCKRSGTVAVNLISSYYGRNAELVRHLYSLYGAFFKKVTIYPASRSLLSFWLPQNFVLIAHAGKAHAIDLRYEAMPPPELDVT